MSDNTNDAELSTNGWAIVPRSFTKCPADVNKDRHAELLVKDVKLPASEIANRTYQFAKEQLSKKTFNHSMRVVYYGKCEHQLSLEVRYLVYTSIHLMSHSKCFLYASPKFGDGHKLSSADNVQVMQSYRHIFRISHPS